MARFPDSIEPLLISALDISAKDESLKYWIIVCLVPLLPIKTQNNLFLSIKRICEYPSERENHEEVQEVASDYIKSFTQ